MLKREKKMKMMTNKQAKKELDKVVGLNKKNFNPGVVKKPLYYEVIEYQQAAARNRWNR